jgi:hypothetical protein
MRLLLAGMTLACLGQVAQAQTRYDDTAAAPTPAAESASSESGRLEPGAPAESAPSTDREILSLADIAEPLPERAAVRCETVNIVDYRPR